MVSMGLSAMTPPPPPPTLSQDLGDWVITLLCYFVFPCKVNHSRFSKDAVHLMEGYNRCIPFLICLHICESIVT